jgi:hypothetical protein
VFLFPSALTQAAGPFLNLGIQTCSFDEDETKPTQPIQSPCEKSEKEEKKSDSKTVSLSVSSETEPFSISKRQSGHSSVNLIAGEISKPPIYLFIRTLRR